MAKSKGRSGGNRRSGAKPAASTRRPEPVVDDIEVVEEEAGLGIDDGIVFMTTLILIVAWLMVDYSRGTNYGEGMLFAGKYQAPTVDAVATE